MSTKMIVTPKTVTSRDGTIIAFEQLGSEPAIVLVGAALSDHGDTAKLANRLTQKFTVINYDRRGRGQSGDTHPYAVEREAEDIEALIDAAAVSSAFWRSTPLSCRERPCVTLRNTSTESSVNFIRA